MKKEKEGLVVWIIVGAFLLALVLTVTIAIQQPLIYNTMCSMFGNPGSKLVSGDASQYIRFESDFNTKEEALAHAASVNEKIVEEGIVMLKNENDALPLAKSSKISVFGKNSVNLVYGGSGSASGEAGDVVTLYDALAESQFDVNPVLKAFYEDSNLSGSGRDKNPGMSGNALAGIKTGETSYDKYTNEVKDSYSQYNDAAIVVISRIGGEGFDLPRTMKKSFDGNEAVDGARNPDDHYLQLDANEAQLIKEVGKEFDNVIVVLNTLPQTFELGFLKDPSHYGYSPSVKGALWIGGTGRTGIKSLGKILNGDVSPSGKTVDILPYDFKKDPTWQNFGSNLTADGNRYIVDGKAANNYYVDYEEGIYIGYRYYETRAYVESDANWYEHNVAYPFGYGLSYGDFSYEIIESVPAGGAVLEKDGELTIKVKVTNNGNRASKETVQLYYSAPYYENGIEKSHVTLGAFTKTEKAIEPGKSEEVTLTMCVADMKSYDYNDANNNDHTGYELDGGNYTLYVSANSHSWADGTAKSVSYTIPEGGYQYTVDTETGNEVKNRFDDVSDNANGIQQYMSRADFEGTFPTMPTAEDRTVDKAFINSLSVKIVDKGAKWEKQDSEMPTQSSTVLSKEQAKVKLYHLAGKSYDDEKWDELLNQLTVGEMAKLIGTGVYRTEPMENIDKPITTDADGPVGFVAFMGDPAVYDVYFYASGVVLASTYNVDLAFAMGDAVGNEAIIGNTLNKNGVPYSGWYAPAVNTHRSQFGGRNWEYMSEDGLVSGKMAAKIIEATKAKGVYNCLKHFALNEQETNRESGAARGGLVTWANEQSIREIYLRPFEIAVKEGKTLGMMSSFNRLGTTWAGGSYALLTEVLRDEWEFVGMVITDFNTPSYGYMNTDLMIRAGGDLSLSQDKNPSTDAESLTATQVCALRRATKNVLYAIANSNAMNGHGEGVVYETTKPLWEILIYVGDAIVIAGVAVWGFFVFMKLKKNKNKEENSEEKNSAI